MLSLREAYETVFNYSAKASEITRQLGFAGIAIIWIFKTDQGGRQIVPGELLPPGLMLVVGLTLDLLQYVVSAIVWYFFAKSKEEAKVTEFKAPRKINWPNGFFFISKIIAIIAAYIYLINYLVSKVF
jgi:hypothetical protein